MRARIQRALSAFLEHAVGAVADRLRLEERTATATKVAQRHLLLHYRQLILRNDPLPPASATGYRIFSQFDEDGIVLFLLGVLGIGPGTFVDIGAGDGIVASNCANLALNLGFHGLFIDINPDLVRQGEWFYAHHPDTAFHPPHFRHAQVTRANVNHLIGEAGLTGEIDLMSIDIDGNDYWIWEAIDCVRPRIVLIEAHVEFGDRSIVVPYDETFVWRKGMDATYVGASPAALTKLGARLGYRLVAANRFGFNLFYVRDELAGERLPPLAVGDLLRHERTRQRLLRDEQIRKFPFEVI